VTQDCSNAPKEKKTSTTAAPGAVQGDPGSPQGGQPVPQQPGQ
jgi:hypothetical protein